MIALSLFILMTGSIWKIVSESSAFGLIILIILVLMSILSWGVIFTKWRQFGAVQADTDRLRHALNHAARLADVVGQAKAYARTPLSQIFLAGYSEMSELRTNRAERTAHQLSSALTDDDFEIVEMTMERTLTDETAKLEKSVVLLATTASAAPFLGLLGTVVGIMDSFWAIGELKSASLAIVAPGIAEALLATIVGLGAAIPAVMAFNWCNNKLKQLNDSSFSFILDFLARAKKEER